MARVQGSQQGGESAEDELRTALEGFLGRHYRREISVGRFSRMAGGASCDVFGFEAVLEPDRAPRELVLRIDAPGKAVRSDRGREFALYQAAEAAGVRVPRALCGGNSGAGLGRAFFVMERVAGEAIARRLLRDPAYDRTRRVLPAQLAGQLARIHAIDLHDPAVEPLRVEHEVRRGAEGGSHARATLAYWKGLLDELGAGHPWPVLVWTGRWLERNAPPNDRLALVHGDFRVGNVLFDGDGLTAVLDWELAHVGDPVEDLGWFCVRSWRFGVDRLEAGGLCSREAFVRAYEEAAGHAVARDRLRYWEIFGNWKWAIASIGQERGSRGGAYPNVELASIGRRVAEMEHEMLALMQED